MTGLHVSEVKEYPGSLGTGVVRRGSCLRRHEVRRPIQSPRAPGTGKRLHDLGCLETPAGATRAKAGGAATAPPNAPLELTITGTAQRKSLVLVIHDSSQPAGRPSDWNRKASVLNDCDPRCDLRRIGEKSPLHSFTRIGQFSVGAPGSVCAVEILQRERGICSHAETAKVRPPSCHSSN